MSLYVYIKKIVKKYIDKDLLLDIIQYYTYICELSLVLMSKTCFRSLHYI